MKTIRFILIILAISIISGCAGTIYTTPVVSTPVYYVKPIPQYTHVEYYSAPRVIHRDYTYYNPPVRYNPPVINHYNYQYNNRNYHNNNHHGYYRHR